MHVGDFEKLQITQGGHRQPDDPFFTPGTGSNSPAAVTPEELEIKRGLLAQLEAEARQHEEECAREAADVLQFEGQQAAKAKEAEAKVSGLHQQLGQTQERLAKIARKDNQVELGKLASPVAGPGKKETDHEREWRLAKEAAKVLHDKRMKQAAEWKAKENALLEAETSGLEKAKAKEALEAQAKEAARLEEAKEKARLEAARVEAARLEAQAKEAARLEEEAKEKVRLEALARLEEAKEKARLEAARVEAARLEAEAKEAARLEEEAKQKARLEAQAKEAARLEVEAKEKALLEAQAKEAVRLEVEAKEKARLEAQAKEAARLEEEAKERARLEAQAKEAARLEVEAKEKARLELEAQVKEAARLQEEAKEKARLEAVRLEAEAAAVMEKEMEAELERVELAEKRAQREKEKAAYKQQLEQERAEKASRHEAVKRIMDSMNVAEAEAEYLLKCQQGFHQRPEETKSMTSSAAMVEEMAKLKIDEENEKRAEEMKVLEQQMEYFAEKIRAHKEQTALLTQQRQPTLEQKEPATSPVTTTEPERSLHACHDIFKMTCVKHA